MDNSVNKVPMHLWIVGGLATLWNAYGCYNYFMTRTQGAAYIESAMPTIDGGAMMAYIDSFPIWASIGWGLGVWGGLVGSILLLVRHRWAVATLGLSFVGAVAGIGYQIANPADIAETHQGFNGIVHYIILAVALGLFVYARAMRIKGALR